MSASGVPDLTAWPRALRTDDASLVRHLPCDESAPPSLVVHMRRPIDEMVTLERTMLSTGSSQNLYSPNPQRAWMGDAVFLPAERQRVL